MALRLMQVFIPHDANGSVDGLLEGCEILGRWSNDTKSHEVIQLLLRAEETEPVTDRFEARYGSTEGFRIVLSPIEAVLPRIEPLEAQEEPEAERETRADAGRSGEPRRAVRGRDGWVGG